MFFAESDFILHLQDLTFFISIPTNQTKPESSYPASHLVLFCPIRVAVPNKSLRRTKLYPRSLDPLLHLQDLHQDGAGDVLHLRDDHQPGEQVRGEPAEDGQVGVGPEDGGPLQHHHL